MAITRYVEDLSPVQMSFLVQTARTKLSLLLGQADHKLSQMLGDALLIGTLELELDLQRQKTELGRKSLSFQRDRPRESPFVTTTTVEVSEED